MKNLSKIFIATSLVVFTSCDPDFEKPVEDIVVSSGDADFSKYIALGNSLTSGYSDNALFISGQENSYPNILASQFAAAGGGSFSQPLMPDDIGGFSDLGVVGKLTLQIIDGNLSPVSTPSQSPFSVASGGPFGNMGVPGAKSFHLAFPGYGNPAGIANGTANAYFARFASSSGTSVLADAAAQNPTFITLWIGNNDVLSYASSGGTGLDQTGNTDPTTYGSNDISDPQVVAGSIQTILSTLITDTSKKGAIANIPSITDVPFFTTVPYAPFTSENLGGESTINALNSTYAPLNQVFDAIGASDRKINFDATTANPVVLKDKNLTDLSSQIVQALMAAGVDQVTAYFYGMTYGQARQANSQDLLVFTSQSILGQLNQEQYNLLLGYGIPADVAGQLSLNGVTYPLTDQWVLTGQEKDAVLTATEAYNTAISQLAQQYNLALVDMYQAMKDLSSDSGITYFGNTFTTTYVSGGAFSLDAVHLTGQGYAVVANYFIDAINNKYGSTIRNVNPNNYPGIKIP